MCIPGTYDDDSSGELSCQLCPCSTVTTAKSVLYLIFADLTNMIVFLVLHVSLMTLANFVTVFLDILVAFVTHAQMGTSVRPQILAVQTVVAMVILISVCLVHVTLIRVNVSFA